MLSHPRIRRAAATTAATPWPNQNSTSEETAVAAITSPISLSDRPRLERNGAKNG
jgi:hypothetical protein